jgi:four helix bundle protein
MDEQEFKRRTKRLALRIIQLYGELPKDAAAQVVGRQLLRCGTSIGANYRAVCRSRSTADMLGKLGIVEEEADETLFWLEVITEGGMLPTARAAGVIEETNEILAMAVASIKTLRGKQ